MLVGERKLLGLHDRHLFVLHVEQFGYVGSHVSQVRVPAFAKYPESQVWLQDKLGFR
jgi:hypothetical protein